MWVRLLLGLVLGLLFLRLSLMTMCDYVASILFWKLCIAKPFIILEVDDGKTERDEEENLVIE